MKEKEESNKKAQEDLEKHEIIVAQNIRKDLVFLLCAESFFTFVKKYSKCRPPKVGASFFVNRVKIFVNFMFPLLLSAIICYIKSIIIFYLSGLSIALSQRKEYFNKRNCKRLLKKKDF